MSLPAKVTLSEAITGYQGGESGRWLAALYASQVVGERDGRTKELSQALALSVSSIEDLAGAGLLYRLLEATFGAGSELERVRTGLTLKHFYFIFPLFRPY